MTSSQEESFELATNRQSLKNFLSSYLRTHDVKTPAQREESMKALEEILKERDRIAG